MNKKKKNSTVNTYINYLKTFKLAYKLNGVVFKTQTNLLNRRI